MSKDGFNLKEALDDLLDKILSMGKEEFRKKLEEHKDGEVAKLLKYGGFFEAREYEKEVFNNENSHSYDLKQNSYTPNNSYYSNVDIKNSSENNGEFITKIYSDNIEYKQKNSYSENNSYIKAA